MREHSRVDRLRRIDRESVTRELVCWRAGPQALSGDHKYWTASTAVCQPIPLVHSASEPQPAMESARPTAVLAPRPNQREFAADYDPSCTQTKLVLFTSLTHSPGTLEAYSKAAITVYVPEGAG
jgi:hypothetical protein